MFGHSEIGSHAFGEFAPAQVAIAIVCRFVVAPRFRVRSLVTPLISGFFRMGPR